jgi:hypothetical protein
VVPLALNRIQKHIHQRLQEQLKTQGFIRAIILKGRQGGVSTYTEGRFYWRVTHRKGVRAFILTHEQEATNSLFEMVERYHEHCPREVRPHTGASNEKEIHFDRLDSGYRVATAGTKAAGRSQTLQYLHWSEVAFSPFAETHATGVMQAVPMAPGTEVILESTANGIGNFFHKTWQDAEAGKSEYIAIFVPWFWTDEYRLPVAADFKLEAEEIAVQSAHDLDLEQMAWRRAKIVELGSEAKFCQEYPATAAEAFQSSGGDSYIPPALVMKARKCVVEEPRGPKLMGVDPARFGKDRTAIAYRQGRRVFKVDTFEKKDTMEVAGIVAKAIKETKPTRVFVDVVGLGAGVVDRLREMGYGELVTPVNGGERPIDAERYVNKRAEMWGEMKLWLEDQPAQIPDDDALHADLTGPLFRYDSKSRVQLEKKEDMEKRGLRSPDTSDALAATFAFPVSDDIPDWLSLEPEGHAD